MTASCQKPPTTAGRFAATARRRTAWGSLSENGESRLAAFEIIAACQLHPRSSHPPVACARLSLCWIPTCAGGWSAAEIPDLTDCSSSGSKPRASIAGPFARRAPLLRGTVFFLGMLRKPNSMAFAPVCGVVRSWLQVRGRPRCRPPGCNTGFERQSQPWIRCARLRMALDPRPSSGLLISLGFRTGICDASSFRHWASLRRPICRRRGCSWPSDC